MKIEFKSNLPAFKRLLEEMAEQVVPAATAQALNSAAGKAKQLAINEASQRTGIPAKTLRPRITTPRSKRATARRPVAVIFGGLWPIPVAKLKPPPRRLKSGRVKYKTARGAPQDPNAFIARSNRGGDGVFVREGRPRAPLNSVNVDVGRDIRFSLIRTLRSGEPKAHFERIFFSQMDRRIIGRMRAKGITVK